MMDDDTTTKNLTVAFTGHRPSKLAGHDREAYRTFTDQLAELLFERYYQSRIGRFITGGAQGFDQLAFWAVEKMRERHELTDISNIVYVPFRGQERIWKEDGCFSKSDYRKMLSRADHVVFLSEPLHERYQIVSALMARNRAMIDDARILCALSNDPSWMEANGGTASAMQYAMLRRIRLDRVRFAMSSEDTGDPRLELSGFEEDIFANDSC